MVSDAIKRLLDSKNLNQHELADMAGMSVSSISNILTGKRKPRKSNIQKIAAALGVTAVELLNERAQITASPGVGHERQNVHAVTLAANVNGALMQFVIPYFEDAQFMISVVGDSMAPRLCGGDLVACAWLPDGTALMWGKIYMVVTNQGKMIKRVQKGSAPELVTLVSDNENYPPFEVELKSISRFARVVGVLSLE